MAKNNNVKTLQVGKDKIAYTDEGVCTCGGSINPKAEEQAYSTVLARDLEVCDCDQKQSTVGKDPKW